MRKIILASVAVLALGACTAQQLDQAKVIMTEAQTASCLAQQNANAVVAAAAKLGDTKGAAVASQASALLGFGCTWTVAAPVAPVVSGS